ncbi:hypothetical protein BASA50_006422 [Batrachochytrium salamandrivorans]|uniref:Mitochondrial thiamine pyrophosphate carrier 1 n=1 Tax=Batrachochytrium salamandrivorans TaxID=1357716 RepID=A0ABQ8FDA4_9FUNG|nr:hypothetical protein BASA62_005794 [Batrachochytrium salamandrivorans]KAH6594747.1 hypothetical protein BASA50_006422 [Batrachochytrium salamandrivorans]
MVYSSSLSIKLTCGAIAGVIGTCLIFPLDIIKTRLQNQKIGTGGPQYHGILDGMQKIVKAEGIRGLYRGLVPNLVGICPEKAIKLAVNDYSREFWGRRLNTNPDSLPLIYGMISGATAGFCQVVVTNPMEIVKIQLQLAGAESHAVSGKAKLTAVDVVRQLGLRGLYKGTAATLARDVPFSFIFFPMVAILKSVFTPANSHGEAPFSVIFGSGIVSGAVGATLVTPMDVVKTRLQVISKPGDKVYSGMMHCYRDIIKHEGVAALFKGAAPRAMIVSPLFAITILIYEFQQRFLGKFPSEL